MKTFREYLDIIDHAENLTEMAARTKFDYTVTVRERDAEQGGASGRVIDKFTVQAQDSESASEQAYAIVSKKYNTTFERVSNIMFSNDDKYLVSVEFESTPRAQAILLRRAKQDYDNPRHIAHVYLKAKSVWLLRKYLRQETHILNVADMINEPAHQQFLYLIDNY